MSSTLQSLKYTTGSLEVIDQLKLPHECVYIPVKDTEAAWSVIKKMQVRGYKNLQITQLVNFQFACHLEYFLS